MYHGAVPPEHTVSLRLVRCIAACLLLTGSLGAGASDVVGFTLIDADADMAIGPLVDGQELDLDLLAT